MTHSSPLPHETPDRALRRLALEAGFSHVSITDVRPPERLEEYQRWLKEGRHGTMEWLRRQSEKRADPGLILSGARSFILVAMPYGHPRYDSVDQTGKARGRVARYAYGEDYHDIMLEKLGRLEEWIRANTGCEALAYVDTGPINERELAARSGLGWQGKSTLLISPKLGNYFFIGEIITTLALPGDQPLKDHCGSCTRCITACPTGAITAPYQMDARRCLSYLTIENKGSIPEEYREAMGDRIYGCDECLDACPWNRFAQESRESRFAPTPWTQRPDLVKLLELTEEEFKKVFIRSPIRRIKRRGLLRNVCVALGNVGDREGLPALHRAAQDPEPLIREHALWAMGRIERRHPVV